MDKTRMIIIDVGEEMYQCEKCGEEMILFGEPREYIKYCWSCGKEVEEFVEEG